MAPTIFFGLRLPTTTYTYDAAGRLTGAIASPPYTAEDHALLLGLGGYEATLCECGFPRHEAWHAEMDGWFEGEGFVCHACTARLRVSDPEAKPVVYVMAHSTLPPEQQLPPFRLGVTTTDS